MQAAKSPRASQKTPAKPAVKAEAKSAPGPTPVQATAMATPRSRYRQTHVHAEHHGHAHGAGPWRLRSRLRALYHGKSKKAVSFRLTVLAIDFLIIALFVAAPLLRQLDWAFYAIDYTIAAVLAFDLIARGYAHNNWRDWLKRPLVWVDLFVLATLLFPASLENLGFLRILRAWTLINSEFFWTTVGQRYDDTRVEEVVKAVVALVTFIFIATGFVYSAFDGAHPGLNGYLDAMYFTVATLTTTGFGDVTLPGPWGRVVAIAIMLIGVSLFLHLAQAIFRGGKVFFPCPICGLRRHDLDAVHCKACGKILAIPDDGL